MMDFRKLKCQANDRLCSTVRCATSPCECKTCTAYGKAVREKNKLLPLCPFCGGIPEDRYKYVVCGNAGCPLQHTPMTRDDWCRRNGPESDLTLLNEANHTLLEKLDKVREELKNSEETKFGLYEGAMQEADKIVAELKKTNKALGEWECCDCGCRFNKPMKGAMAFPAMMEGVVRCSSCAEGELLRGNLRELKERLGVLAEAGTGYSQETVDALTEERDNLSADFDTASKQSHELLGEVAMLKNRIEVLEESNSQLREERNAVFREYHDRYGPGDSSMITLSQFVATRFVPLPQANERVDKAAGELSRMKEDRDEWIKVVTQCAEIFGCPDEPTTPLNCNLPNLCRDLRSELADVREERDALQKEVEELQRDLKDWMTN